MAYFSPKGMLSLAVLISSATSYANTVVCEGEIEILAYHANNNLMLKLSSMNVPVFFCSPDANWTVAGTDYQTGPNSCQTMYSTFLAAKLAGKRLASVYFDGDQVPDSCNGWGNWQKANIRYFVIK
ncbi:MAG: hypothetical protein ACK4GU_11535 [Alishewanella aestuarii]|jgi:hypothetical protein